MKSRVGICLLLPLFTSFGVMAGEPAASDSEPNTFDELMKAIRSGDVHQRLNTIQQRSDELLEFAQTGSTSQRVEAIQAIVWTKDPRIIPILVDMLDDPNDRIRNCVAFQLARLADPRAMDALAAALGDSSARVRQYAATGLAKIGNEGHVPALVESIVNHLSAPNATGRQSDYLSPALEAIGGLASQAPPEIVALLGRIGDETIAEDDDWWRLQTYVATCLGRIGDKAALDDLRSAIDILERNHQDYATWLAIRKALAVLDPMNAPFDRPVAEMLVVNHFVKGYGQGFYESLVLPVAKLGPEAVPDLAWALNFESKRDRHAVRIAVDALGEIGGPKAADVLRAYIARQSGQAGRAHYITTSYQRALLSLLRADPSDATVTEVTAQLRHLGTNEQSDLVRDIAKMAPGQLATEIQIAILRETLLLGDRAAGPLAAEALGQTGGPVAGQILSDVLLSPSSRCRDAAARALGCIEGYQAMPTLMAAAATPDTPVEGLAWAMGNMEDPNVIPILREITRRPHLHKEERRCIAAALARLGYDRERNAAIVFEGLPATYKQYTWMAQHLPIGILVDLVKRANTQQSYWAVEALAGIGTPDALEALMALADTKTDLRHVENISRAAWNLGRGLEHPRAEDYQVQCEVTRAVLDEFHLTHEMAVHSTHRKNRELFKKFPRLARRLWIQEAMRRLDLAQTSQTDRWASSISREALGSIEVIFDNELIPVLERIATEETGAISFHGRDGMVTYYYVRSRAAAILTEKTGRQHTFVDIDGRTHPGGWHPPSSGDIGGASIRP